MHSSSLKMPFKRRINSKLTQHSTACFACSWQKLGILTDMQNPYLRWTSSDTLSPNHRPNIKILLECFFLLAWDLIFCGGRMTLYRCVIEVTSLLSHWQMLIMLHLQNHSHKLSSPVSHLFIQLLQQVHLTIAVSYYLPF